MCRLPFLTLILCATLFTRIARAEAPPSLSEEKKRTFGASFSPAALPPGGASMYGYFGVQEVGAGYRQGTSLGEVELRANFNYLLLSFGGEVVGKLMAWHNPRWEIAPTLGLGVGYDTGSRYFDNRNFQSLLVRVEPGAIGTYRVHETLSVLGAVNVPMDFGVTTQGGFRIVPLIGGGAEYYLGEDVTVGGLLQIGGDIIREPLGVPQTRVGYSVKIAVGYRLF